MIWIITISISIALTIGFLGGVIYTQSKAEQIYCEKLEEEFNNSQSDLK